MAKATAPVPQKPSRNVAGGPATSIIREANLSLKCLLEPRYLRLKGSIPRAGSRDGSGDTSGVSAQPGEPAPVGFRRTFQLLNELVHPARQTRETRRNDAA